MIVDKTDAGIGDRVEILLDYTYYGTIIERTDLGFILDYINSYGQHKRNQLILFKDVVSCTRSDIDTYFKGIIIAELKNRGRNHKVYQI